MDINIPSILAGGAGRAMQEAGQGGLDSANKRAQVIGGIVSNNIKAANDQQNLIEASRIENDMLVTKEQSADNKIQTDDGTNPLFLDQVREEDERLGQDFIKQGSNEEVKKYLTKIHLNSQKGILLKAQGAQEQHLWNTSIETAKIKTDNIIRATAPNGDFDGGIAGVNQYMQSQSGFFGDKTDSLTSAMESRYSVNFLKAGLNDPVTAPVLARRLENPGERQKIFSKIPVDQIDDIEKLLKSAAKDGIRQDAYTKLYAEFQGDAGAASVALNDPTTQKKLGLNLEDTFFVKNRLQESAQDKLKLDEARWDKNAMDLFVNLKSTTPGKIDAAVVNNDISWKIGEHFKRMQKEDKEAPSDPYTWSKLYSQVKDATGDPDALQKVRTAIIVSGGVSVNDKKHLLQVTENNQDQFETLLIKKGADHIKQMVMPSETMISSAKPEEARQYIKSVMDYETAINNYRKGGKLIDADFITRTAGTIAEANRLSIADQLKAAQDQMKKDMKPKQVPARKPQKAKMPDGTIIQSVDGGTTWTDPTGKVIQ
jgi:hypothetical protein